MYILLQVLGIELGRYAKDAIIDRSDVSQFLLVRLPGDKGLPKTVGTKVGPCCKYRMLICTKEGKTIVNFRSCNKHKSYQLHKRMSYTLTLGYVCQSRGHCCPSSL